MILSTRQAFADFGVNEAQNNKDISVSRNTIAFPFYRAFLTLHDLYTATKFSTFICITLYVFQNICIFAPLRINTVDNSVHTRENLDCSDNCPTIFYFLHYEDVSDRCDICFCENLSQH